MLSIITPTLTYFDSFKIREILKEISEKVKMNQDWDIKEYWGKISKILSTDSVLLQSWNASVLLKDQLCYKLKINLIFNLIFKLEKSLFLIISRKNF